MQSGKKMPCDPERRYVYENKRSLPEDERGTEKVVHPAGFVATGWPARADASGSIMGYRPHWASCEDRKKKGGAAAGEKQEEEEQLSLF